MKRKNKSRIILLLAFLLFFSYIIHGSKAQVELIETGSSIQLIDSIPLKQFEQFIGKFKLLQYPFSANTDCYEPDTTLSVPLDMDNDSIFIEYSGPGISVGMLPDTANFYAVIYCTAVACYMPVLAVFSKKGKLLSKQAIANGCGAGVGYSCSETLTIKSLKDIEVINIQEQYDYDNSGIEIPNSHKKTVDLNKYSIDDNGVIKVVTSHSVQKE